MGSLMINSLHNLCWVRGWRISVNIYRGYRQLYTALFFFETRCTMYIYQALCIHWEL